MAGNATITGAARNEPMHKTADAAAENLAQCPRPSCRRAGGASKCSLACSLSAAQMPMSACVAAASIAGAASAAQRSLSRMSIVRSDRPLAHPLPSKRSFALTDGRSREEMSFNVVGFVNIRLDERQTRDPRIAAHHVQHRHAAALPGSRPEANAPNVHSPVYSRRSQNGGQTIWLRVKANPRLRTKLHLTCEPSAQAA